MRLLHRHSATALLLAAGLAACMGGPRPSDVTERRNAAASYVLTQRAFALALAKQCRVGPASSVDLTSRARIALESWEQRNRVRLDAASRYFEDYLAVVARREGRRKAIDRRGALTGQHTASGARAAQASVERAGGRAGCPDLLESLGSGEFDIASAEFDPVLDELADQYGGPK
jgi:hypothetical protein